MILIFYISMLAKTTNQLNTLMSNVPEIHYRGYEQKSYPEPELYGIYLPVNLIAFNQCPTQRDVYHYVNKIKLPNTWDRYEGRVIHSFYEIIYNYFKKIIRESNIRTIEINHKIDEIYIDVMDEVFNKNNNEYKKLHKIIDGEKLGKLRNVLQNKLYKIFLYEKSIASGMINFEISRLFSQSAGEPLFQKAFSLHIQQQFSAKDLGFTQPVSPDFMFGTHIVGDIKSGPWKEYYTHTLTAYALAVEHHKDEDINCGIIFHIDLDKPRQVPIVENTRFCHVDDTLRRKFVTIRDQKLYIAKYKEDPGIPETRDECIGCGYFSNCWGDE